MTDIKMKRVLLAQGESCGRFLDGESVATILGRIDALNTDQIPLDRIYVEIETDDNYAEMNIYYDRPETEDERRYRLDSAERSERRRREISMKNYLKEKAALERAGLLDPTTGELITNA